MKDKRLYIELLLVIVIFVGALVACGLYLRGEILAMTCSDFTSRDGVQEALSIGNKNLDGDRDGLACENIR